MRSAFTHANAPALLCNHPASQVKSDAGWRSSFSSTRTQQKLRYRPVATVGTAGSERAQKSSLKTVNERRCGWYLVEDPGWGGASWRSG